MAIVGFRQDPGAPPGAGFFRGSDGKEKYAYAPDVAAKFAGAAPQMGLQPLPDARLALGALPPTEARLAAGGAPPGVPPSMSDAAPNFGPPAPPGGVPQGAARTIPSAPMPPPPSTELPQQPGPNMQQEAVGDILRSVANGPVGPKRPAGWHPKSQSVTVEQGAPYSEEQANDRAQAEANVQRAHLASTQAYADQQEAQAAAIGLQKEKIQTDLQEAQGKQNAKQQMYDDERARVQGLMDATTSQQVDPGRWFKKNTFGGVMAIIGQAMQNFASIKMGHGPTNAALDSIIDRDVAAQRADIEQGRVKTGNALHMLNTQFRDLDQSQAALKMIQQKAVDAEIARQAALHNSQDARSKTGEWIAQRGQDFVKSEQAFQNAAMGKTTIKTDQAYQPATGGGITDPLERLKRMGIGAEQLRKMGVPEEQIAKGLGLPSTGGKDVKQEAQAYGKEIEASKANEVLSSLAPVEAMLNKYAGQDKVPGIGPENIATRVYRGVADTVGGQGTAEKQLYSDEERNNRQTFEFMKADVRHAITGAGMSDTERKNLDDMVEKARTPSDLRNAVNTLRERATKRVDLISQAYSPEAVQLYNSRATPEAPAPLRKVGP
jgi:hypothetical protein